MKKGNVALAFIGLFVLIVAGTYIFFPQAIRTHYDDSLKSFDSCQDLETYLQTSKEALNNMRGGWGVLDVAMTFDATSGAVPMASQEKAESAPSDDYSTTNIQVEGVDEADIVKNDGKYIYTVSGNKLVIIDAYPAENAEIVSEIELGGTPQELYINDDRLIVFGYKDYDYAQADYEIMPRYYRNQMFIKVFDVSDRTNPTIARDVSFDGSYHDSRMIGNYAYVIINSYLDYDDIEMPEIEVDGTVEKACDCPDIYYFDYPDYFYSITSILSLNVKDDNEEIESKNYLIGSSQNMFVSQDNIYVTYNRGGWGPVLLETGSEPEMVTEQTVIHKIAINDGDIEYKTRGSVPGRVLNQFSMDEYEGYFRIATTLGRVTRTGGSTSNNVYVLDENLNTIGELEELAPGESIYSARFMGDRVYLVTFRKIDPLFVIDLSIPSDPKVLGKLKIPGYSDYLHPYDDNYIIGIGKEVIEAKEGDFSWYQGVKLSLFDVTDVEKPKEISKLEIGDRGTDSNALYDHKAFLFSKSKGIIVIPITLAEIDEEKYPGGVPANMHGDFVWQGAYVIDINLEDGLNLRGRVTHLDDSDYFTKSGYYFYTPYSVQRSLYIGDYLYTLSNKLVKANDLETLEELNKIELPYEEERYYGYPEPIIG